MTLPNPTKPVDSDVKQKAAKRYVWGYYVTAPGGIVACLPDGKRNFLSFVQDEIIQEHYRVTHGVPEVVDLSREIAGHSTTKRKAEAMLPAVDDEKPVSSGGAKMLEESYWDSPEAKKLFLARRLK